MDTNKVVLTGRLGRDIDVKYTPKGTAVANLSVAVGRAWTDESGEKKEETTWVEVTVWGKQAETAGQYLGKGSALLVEGRLSSESWEDRETGKKRSKVKVTAERIQFLGRRRESEDENGGQGGPTEQEEAQQAPAKRGRTRTPKAEEVPAGASGEDDNIPF